jgi:CDP-paratose 2-epimerase
MAGHVLVTGGCGFIGSNVAARFAARGARVVVFDDFSRRGSRLNAAWLRRAGGRRLHVVAGDVRDPGALRRVVEGADLVVHLAAQVAVTTSVEDPVGDFEVNAAGTLAVLEAVRARAPRATVIFTSTNKVYGAMEDLAVVEEAGRYRFRDVAGVAEDRPLDFHSPYGCSKGAADQYVRDYARIYGLRTVVFRMSCIYGPRQFGTEEQGWIAHFLIAALSGRPLVIYGDGKQVRDVLYVEDLARAMELAARRISRTAGQAYNIGGGPANTVSVWAEFRPLLERLTGNGVKVSYAGWRPGDQKVYVSDVGKAWRDFGWRPRVALAGGAARLCSWLARAPEALRVCAEAAAAARTRATGAWPPPAVRRTLHGRPGVRRTPIPDRRAPAGAGAARG